MTKTINLPGLDKRYIELFVVSVFNNPILLMDLHIKDCDLNVLVKQTVKLLDDVINNEKQIPVSITDYQSMMVKTLTEVNEIAIKTLTSFKLFRQSNSMENI
jgi:hypothetical protein